jgi:uncharacterized membrane protein HdeD (DUF308 family)
MNDKAEEVKAEVVGSEERPGTMAIIALVCGILSMLCCAIPVFGFILSIAALVLGIIEVKKIGRNESSPKGKGMAIAGIILGAAGLLFGIIIWAILLPLGIFTGSFFGEWFNYYN